jgi:hypothetical protein
MQCRTDGLNQQCNRCRSSEVPCNYSEPGKPGRPPTKGASVITQNISAVPEPIQSVSTPSGQIIAEDEAWIRDILNSGMSNGSQQFMGMEMEPWPQHSFVNVSSATSCMQLGQENTLGTMSWPSSITQMSSSSLASENLPIHEGILGDSGIITDPQPLLMNSDANTTGCAVQDYIQKLAHFQVTIARVIDCGSYLNPSRLEQEAAYVLESSSIFLELVQIPTSSRKSQGPSNIRNCSWEEGLLQELHNDCADRHRCKRSRESSAFDTAVVLQLISISMRLTELHHWFYSTVHRYLQQNPDWMRQTTDGVSDRPPACSLSFSVAGVDLAPHPHFQLQMLLYTGFHYLTRIQKTLSELEALGSDDTSQRPLELARHTRMLVSEDRQTRMAQIRLVLAKLKDDFGVSISV